MSIIFGFPNNRGIKVSDVLASQGLNLLRCTLSTWDNVVTVSANQPAYRSYSNYLPAYMSAFTKQTRISVIQPYHPLQYGPDLPIVQSRVADVSVSFPSLPAAEILEALRSVGGAEMTIKGVKILLLPSPSRDTLQIAARAGAIRTTPAPIGSINIQCFGTISLVRRIFSNFLFTHQYPAFADADHLEYNEAHWVIAQEVSKRKRDDNDADSANPRKRGPGVESSAAAHDVDEEMEESRSVAPPKSNKILYAIPPPIIDFAWGDVDQLPNNDGIFLRFVEETQNGDKERAVQDTLCQYFLGCLGQTAEEVRSSFDRVRSDMGLICHTLVGKELAHLAKSIDIGIKCQARIFPIVSEGQYLGSALLGAGYQISAYGSVYVPVNNQTLISKIQQAGSHASSLLTIAKLATNNDPEHELWGGILECTSIVQLRKWLMEAELTSEERDQVVAHCKKLHFKSKSLNASVANIVECLRLIQFADATLPDTFPLHPAKIFEKDRVHLIWSAFGDLAPTCSFPGGPLIDLTVSKKVPAHIAFRTIPLKDALIDLDMMLSSKKFSGTTNNRRSGPFKDRMYTGLDAKNIFSSLASAAGVVQDKGNKGKEKAVENVSANLFDDGF